MKIAITTSSFAKYGRQPLERLEAAGLRYELNSHGRQLTEDEVLALLDGCVGLVAGTEPLTRRVIEARPELKVISRCGTGLDNVDLAAAQTCGLAVCNTPFGPTLAVAELTLGLALDLLRQVSRSDRELKAGLWKKRMGHNLAGKRLGIIGFGRIGQAVAGVFLPLGVEVGYYDPVVTVPPHSAMTLDDLLAWAGIVSLHLSKPSGGGVILGARELGLMKAGSWLINCARGGVVDEAALHSALRAGHLAGAAVDVFAAEPYRGPLTELDNVILTPHIGSYARESRIQMEIDAVENLIRALGLGN